MMPTPEELDGPISQFMESIGPIAKAAADCYQTAQEIAVNTLDVPHSYLARQWIVWSQSLAMMRDHASTEICLSSLRAIAICMLSTQYKDASLNLEVITTVTQTYEHIKAQTTGETKQ